MPTPPIVEHGGSPGIAQTVVGFGSLFEARFQTELEESSRSNLNNLLKAVVTSHFSQQNCGESDASEAALHSPSGQIDELTSPVAQLVADTLHRISDKPGPEAEKVSKAIGQTQVPGQGAPEIPLGPFGGGDILIADTPQATLSCWPYTPGSTSAVANGVTRFALTISVRASGPQAGFNAKIKVQYAGIVWQDGERPIFDSNGWPTGNKEGDPVVTHQQNCPSRNCQNDWVTGQVHLLVKLKLEMEGGVSPGGLLKLLFEASASAVVQTQLNLSMPFKHEFDRSVPISGQPGVQGGTSGSSGSGGSGSGL